MMWIWRYELTKILFSYRGLLLIAAFVVLKTALLIALPELKDERIKLSQKNYDKVLSEIHGPTTPEKEEYITSTYAKYRETLERFTQMKDAYLSGKISRDEWEKYSNEYGEANLYINSFEIFNEKREIFAALLPYGELLPPAYFYEYGWNSALTYMGFPDPLSLILVLLLAVQMICPEASSGILKINLCTHYGRAPLFLSKFAVLSFLLLIAAAISVTLEIAVFSLRFDLSQPHWGIYSVAPYDLTLLPYSLAEGILHIASIRAAGLIMLGLFAFGVACFTQNAAQTIFCVTVCVVIPWFVAPGSIFTFGAWLSGQPIFKSARYMLAAIAPATATAAFLYASYIIKIKRKRKALS
ncbi:MAG: hypothetical protein FWH17_05185 [Oscillospiraceae bacterium]|nr:hypothetical protein [Oscillospiraceae bacterium]